MHPIINSAEYTVLEIILCENHHQPEAVWFLQQSGSN